MGYFHKNVLPESGSLSLPYGVIVSRSSKVATQSICVDLLEILEEILSYGIGVLFTPLNLFLLCLSGVCQTWPSI